MPSLVELAEQAVSEHIPYVWGGAGPSGVDCSGLMQWLYGQEGIKIPRTSREQKKAGQQISLQQAQPGDLLIYTYYGSASNPPPDNHVGMYVSPGRMIDAARPGTDVRFDPIDTSHLSAVVHITGNYGSAGVADAAAYAAQTGTAVPVDWTSWPGNILGTLGGWVNQIPNPLDIVGGAISSTASAILQGILVAVGPIILTTVSIALAAGLVVMGLWRMTQNTEAGKAAGSIAKKASVAAL